MHATTLPSPSSAPVTGFPGVTIGEVVGHRAYLVRFAMRRLRDPGLAEDVVHDVFEAVLSGRASFGGRAALRSWLTAVLKNKIVDALRRADHHESLDDDHDDGADARRGALAVACPRPRPEEMAEHRQRLARALAGIDALPPTLRETMRLRVLQDQPTAAICRQLGISEENLFVRVHRARQQLLS